MNKINFRIIKEFIRNNKLLTMLIFIAFILIISIVFTKQNISNSTNIENVNTIEVINNLQKTNSIETEKYKMYLLGEEIFVEVNDKDYADENAIRNTLNIPSDVKINIVLLGAATGPIVTD